MRPCSSPRPLRARCGRLPHRRDGSRSRRPRPTRAGSSATSPGSPTTGSRGAARARRQRQRRRLARAASCVARPRARGRRRRVSPAVHRAQRAAGARGRHVGPGDAERRGASCAAATPRCATSTSSSARTSITSAARRRARWIRRRRTRSATAPTTTRRAPPRCWSSRGCSPRAPRRRSIVVAHFSGEELGLLGSQWFVEHPPVPLEQRAGDAELRHGGPAARRPAHRVRRGDGDASCAAIVDSANVAPRLAISAQGDGFGPSDHSSFYAQGHPGAALLHRPARRLSSRDRRRREDQRRGRGARGGAGGADHPRPRRPARAADVRARAGAGADGGPREGSNTYLGSIPDMAAGDVAGPAAHRRAPGSPGGRSAGSRPAT